MSNVKSVRAPCPFCGNTDISDVDIIEVTIGYRGSICCLNCWASLRGELCPTVEEAANSVRERWDTRYSPITTISSTARDKFGRPKGPKKTGRKPKPDHTIDHFFQCRMKTDDDWYPNLESADGTEDEVEVSVLGWSWQYTSGKKDEKAYRVCVWGADDTGMERDYGFDETTPTELVKFVLSWPTPVNRDWLEQQGFYPA